MASVHNLLKTSTSETNETSERKLAVGEIHNGTTNSVNDKLKFVEDISTSLGTDKLKTAINLELKTLYLSVGREKRNIPSPLINLHEVLSDPQSPSSSSTTSQATSANDATFEPTIEMMVNDFDDEQTLNEEEALAALETQDPDEEINTLKEESEMPLEELLAKYSDLNSYPSTSFSEPFRKKSKKSSQKKKNKLQKQEVHSTNASIDSSSTLGEVVESSNYVETMLDSVNAETDDKIDLQGNTKLEDCDDETVSSTLSPMKHATQSAIEEQNKSGILFSNGIIHSEILKVRRSHLLDLYPKGTFDNVVGVKDAIAGISKEPLYGAEDDEDEEIEEEDEDYKKKVMIGAAYQANIPVGLSLYGDILPYENEDKLIWEPSQVSEREVEEYLLKIRDIKSNQEGDEEGEESAIETNVAIHLKQNSRSERNTDNLENHSLLANGNKLYIVPSTTIDMDNQAVVKDNEQALHLLVQCGYDFKEALRRKSLNSLPLNDCMSLWSEEESHKFEEGIQKYGKDFLKIRQNQVRTRTMRELVQFYYLWKKSERRDHNFANADTVDHMDIYLNEDNEYGSTPPSVVTPVSSPIDNYQNCTGTRKTCNPSQKNVSIMTIITTSTPTTTVASTTCTTTAKNISNASFQHHKKRTPGNYAVTSQSEFNNENSVNNQLTKFSK